ncbi:GNAT family N-acetyltransferase [Actinomadura fibrosa]|uniref:GNAT family N-acetyltransferase n=1 Tax=Actinomadura fibrosa TaxID=111802 RepID=A0ABW2XQ01_9ACTN|nr:GNAT family N-acetyltransferase [Actinomadura fibrosa]
MSELVTERLLLVPWEERFKDELARLTSDPLVHRYLADGRPWDAEFVEQRHRVYLEHWRAHGFGWRGILGDGAFLGVAVLAYAGTRFPGVESSAFEIGWWLYPRYWGRGFAVEAATAVRDDAFERLGAERVVARFWPENAASERVAIRLGMRVEREAVGASGERIRICVLDRDDWERHRSA